VCKEGDSFEVPIDTDKEANLPTGTSSRSLGSCGSNPDLRGSPAVNLRVFQILSEKLSSHSSRSLLAGKVVPYRGDPHQGLADALSTDATDQKSYWVHVEADERYREGLDEWIDRLNLGSYISDQMKRPADEWMSQVLCTKSTALVMIRIVQLIDEKGTFTFDEVEYLTAIVTTRMLLTYDVINVTSAHTTNALIAHMTQNEVLREGSTSAALLSWLEFHVRNTKNAAIGLRNESVLMTKKMDLEPKNVHLKDILNLRGDVLFIDSVAEEQNHCLAMMRDMDTESDGADFGNVEGALEMLVKTAKSTELMSERMEKRVEDLKNAFGAHQQERMNSRLAMLTVLSAIFMPLTFGAGVYGMNFDNIPELSTEYGYFVWWGVMLAMAFAMTTYFYIDGWFH
jgi:Mg2+ and Co2+ transporter CorA